MDIPGVITGISVPDKKIIKEYGVCFHRPLIYEIRQGIRFGLA